jgi:hypothetical protein
LTEDVQQQANNCHSSSLLLPLSFPCSFFTNINTSSAEAGDQVEIQAAPTHVFFHLFEIKLVLPVDVIMRYRSIQIFFPDSLCLWI